LTGLTGSAGSSGSQGSQGIQGEAGAQGSNGPAGSDGVDGAAGTDGATGATGASGPQGLQGVQGNTGAPGSTGPAGTDGSDGTNGIDGTNGAAGTNGTNGAPGADGIDGADGATGATGAAGPAGPAGPVADLEYAYIYNDSAETLAIGGAVNFDTNGEKTAGITHGAGTDAITLVEAGTYRVSFSASTVEPSQMALFIGGNPIAGSIYGSGAGTQQNTGEVIVTTAAPNAVLTLRNYSSAAAVGLQTAAGGTQANTNASVLIQQLVEGP